MEIGLLGPLRVVVDGRAIELSGARLPALLAALAMGAPHPVPADRLTAAVWGHDGAVNTRANLHSNIRRLRQLLGAELVVAAGTGYALRVAADQVDALRFSRLLDAAAGDPASEHARLVQALGLWRGEPFDGVRSEWLHSTHTARLEERRLAAVQRRIDLELATGLGDPAGALGELRALLARNPLREPLWARLLALLARSGRSAEALELYGALRRRLADELGVDPSAELQQLHATLLDAPSRPVPRQLPAGVAAFAGRSAALRALDGWFTRSGPAARRPVVISGSAGVGKTALALHFAHRVADRFPDGQLHVDLRGFDPSGSPVAPAEALHEFLEALQVPPQRIPRTPDGRAALYRSVLAGSRTLVLLDNAHDAEQVAPLLPGSPGCLVLVTSRAELPGLLASTAAHPLVLDVLDQAEAEQLLAGRIGRARVAAEPEATSALITRTAGLPLALAVVAARAATRPRFPLAAVADELQAGGGLSAVATGGPDPWQVFSWSYERLSAPAAQLFRQLALHPGPDITCAAAAGLAGGPADAALAELARAHLVTEHLPGRYRFHDLLRAYAHELAIRHDSAADRRRSTERMLDHYLHTAHRADKLLPGHGEPVDRPAGGTAERIDDGPRALAWFAAEHAVLLAVIATAADGGFPRHALGTAEAMNVVLHRRGRWLDRVATQRTALAVARRLGEPAAQSRAHRELGLANADLGRFDDAHHHLDRALALAADDTGGRAWTYYCRDLVHGQQGRDAEALAAAELALRLFEAGPDRAGRAIALTDVGWYRGRLGDSAEALRICTEALAEHRDLGNRSYEAHTWACLGEIHDRRAEPASAASGYEHALALFGEIGDRFGEASTLACLAELHDRAGAADRAAELHRHARALLTELDPPAAEQLRTVLRRKVE
ncbi:BTAD domain-containing putative transcriptional regulator [Pseudonocardia xinjiangensis]|uniref:AfsR/SARP family transcriptional regulator n=1 Tax=Pseudonocardia xinjiangensis TaxID=75289 RepID=UPI003D902C94